jgi:23S rRNA pseudouridine955/2504/2580 synthase
MDGKKAKADARVQEGSMLTLPDDISDMDKIIVSEPDTAQPHKEGHSVQNLEILFEDDRILAVGKNTGEPTHGPNSLGERVLLYLKGKLAPSLSFLPGPLHRLDQGTSGIVVFSKSLEGARLFSSAIASRRVQKSYLVVLDGVLEAEQVWEDTLVRDATLRRSYILVPQGIGTGMEAFSRAVPLAANDGICLARIQLGTGRTHQIRVQASSRGMPLLGDKKYGGSPLSGGFLLHAYKLILPQEFDNKTLTLLPPLRFMDFIETRFGGNTAIMIKRGFPG